VWWSVGKRYLTKEGVVGYKFCIAPRNEFDVNDAGDVFGEDFGKVINDEAVAEWAQAFIVEV